MTISAELEKRNLPPFPAEAAKTCREHILRLLASHVYGHTPQLTGPVYSYVESSQETPDGIGILSWIRLSFETPAGMYSFPFQLCLPKKEDPVPVFIHIAFRPAVKASLQNTDLDEPMPLQEILSRGYAAANLYYEDVTSDSPRSDGLALAWPSGEKDSWGKIGMWAFAASRIMDYLQTRREIDAARAAVAGWSRLGKTALWCAAQDSRLSLAAAFQSGCGGAALFRQKEGETIADITSRFPYWFCPVFQDYAGKEELLPLDQHFLLASIAPRAVLIGTAAQDRWADPISEYLSAAAASLSYESCQVQGLACPGSLPAAGDTTLSGQIGFYIRSGAHGMTRTDWQKLMQFREMHGV